MALLAHNSFRTVARLNSTLAHEMCHIATWLISKDMKNPHGKNFKMWGSKVNRYRPDIVVTVSTGWKSCRVLPLMTDCDLADET